MLSYWKFWGAQGGGGRPPTPQEEGFRPDSSSFASPEDEDASLSMSPGEDVGSAATVAAKIAQKAKVKKLILGHYSSRYSDKNLFFKEASSIFKEVDLSEDFKTFLI